jgi:hypothetical protein
MISYFVSSNIPISDKCVVGIVERREVGHLDRATVRILPLSKELIDSIESIGLNGIIGSEDNELRYIRLESRPSEVTHGQRIGKKTYGRKTTWGTCASTITVGQLALARIARVPSSR